MEQKKYQILKKIGWILLVLLLFFNFCNWYQIYHNRIKTRVLPFDINKNMIVLSENYKDYHSLADKTITAVDTFKTAFSLLEKINFPFNVSDQNKFEKHIASNEKVTIFWKDKENNETGSLVIETVKSFRKIELLTLVFNIFLVLIVFFNCYLLLRFSAVSENVLIVFFLLFLAFPEEINPVISGFSLNSLVIPFIGIIFCDFINIKIKKIKNLLLFYLISLLLALGSIFLEEKINEIVFIAYGWTLIWLLMGFIKLARAYRKTKSIELKRLSNAFRGFLIALISGLFGIILGIVIFSVQGNFNPEAYNLFSYVIILFLFLTGLSFIVGLLWFFGSFTWSLLTGTAMDVKIRSTLIYSIVGIFFVTIFGLLDYCLGEFLQKLFGNFIGSEFIAGIPATIGLLLFFNPIRNKVATIVDKRLNSSELDFLSKADTFSENIGEEGVIEGFEEYICENMIHKLSIKKVALISYDKRLGGFKFNEVRGSNIVENSLVNDIKDILSEPKPYSNFRENEDLQDIASFNLVIPIIFDAEAKWFLALGKKNDGTSYTKKDEEALIKLTDRIKLSLKFILAYDDMINDKYSKKINDLEQSLLLEKNKNLQLTRLMENFEKED